MSSDQIEIAALGRPFSLGMLYDARKDQLMTGFTLCNDETIKKNTSTKAQNSCSYHITASDTFESKSSLLDVNVSLKASILGGLIDVGGSASYLNDKKKFKNQSRVTLQYKATTTYEHLSLSHLEHKELEAKGFTPNPSATHVVTGILYGANAFFVFDSEKLDSSSLQKIGASAKAAINKIPLFSFEASVKVELSEEEKDVTNKFSCKFYGDLILDKNPATFEDAVKTYSRLPELLGKNGEKSVPVKVWLTPLKDVLPSASEPMGDFSVGLVRKATNALESMREMEMRCNEALDEKVVQSFPQLHKKVKRFQDLCSDYTALLRKTIQKKILLIREGKEDEKSVEKLLDDQENSAFSPQNLDKWLDNTEREINIIRSCVESIEGIETVAEESDLDREVLAAGVEISLCFVFTSVETDDPFIEQMTDYLRRDKARPPPSVTAPTKDHWFFSNDVVTNMRKKASEFYSIAKNLKSSRRFRFLIAALPNKKFKGATIYQYMDGLLKTEDFKKPVITDITANLDRRDFMYYYCDLTLDPTTASDFLQLSEGNKKATKISESVPDKIIPHVLCREGLTSRHYFEFTWSIVNQKYVGVVLACTGGKPGKQTSFEAYNHYWTFYCMCLMYSAGQSAGMTYTLHPPDGCNRFAVYLDCPAGTVSFYSVCGKDLVHLHTFKHKFNEPVYPGLFMLIKDDYVSLCPVE
ncbi:PREDICTED: stonustoxin subunit alpha-like [Cyprinodon variegatus]|uniref:Stonustoxin subunit alpha-like n=1 Tax=Cyprinodon variegatus TaxID=28743 RepID=A0A3Q2E869_CYPVA|nr:PREDICTED: stonustoxin subunit alpha-like [Cyprinodon variegatus]